MSDLYYKDTEEALKKFSAMYTDLDGVLTSDFIDCFDTLANEVAGILKEYSERCEQLEDLEYELKKG